MAWEEEQGSPFLVAAPEQNAARGALAPQESGGLTRFLGNVARGFNRVMSSPAYARLWSGMVSGMAGDPMAGPRALQQLRDMQTPSIQDELARYRLRQMKREEEEDAQKNALRTEAFAKYQAGDYKGAKPLLAQLFPQLAAEQMFAAPPKPSRGVPVMGTDGKPTIVPVGEDIGREPYRQPPATVNVDLGSKSITELRKSFAEEDDEFRTSVSGVRAARALVEQANRTNSGASDTALIYTAARTLDPQARAVTDGDFQNLAPLRTVPQNLKFMAEKLWKDQTARLSQRERQEILAMLETRASTMADAARQRRRDYMAAPGFVESTQGFIFGGQSVDDLLRSAGMGGKDDAAPPGVAGRPRPRP